MHSWRDFYYEGASVWGASLSLSLKVLHFEPYLRVRCWGVKIEKMVGFMLNTLPFHDPQCSRLFMGSVLRLLNRLKFMLPL